MEDGANIQGTAGPLYSDVRFSVANRFEKSTVFSIYSLSYFTNLSFIFCALFYFHAWQCQFTRDSSLYLPIPAGSGQRTEKQPSTINDPGRLYVTEIQLAPQ